MVCRLQLMELDPEGFHIALTASLYGQQVRLLVDTGANHTCFDQQFFDTLAASDTVTGQDDVNVGIGGNDFTALIATVGGLRIGSRKIPQFTCRLLDLQHVNAAYELAGFPPIQGVLGGDILHKYHAVIDYQNQTLELRMGDKVPRFAKKIRKTGKHGR